MQVFPKVDTLQKEIKTIEKKGLLGELQAANSAAYLPFPPRRINIGITSHCNYNCPFCFNHTSHQYDYIQSGRVSSEAFTNLLRRIDGAETLAFEVMGESLLHPRCLDYMEQATAYVKRIALTTNGSLLNADITHRILNLPMDEVFFSCDASDAKTYERLRTKGSFEVFKSNVGRLSRHAKFRLNFNAIVFSMNMDSLLGLPKLAVDLGIHRIQFVPQNVTMQAKRSGFIPPSEADLNRFILRIMNECRKVGIDYQFVWSLMGPSCKTVFPNYAFSSPCMMPFDSLSIDPFGRTNFCCYLEWMDSTNGLSDALEPIWNSHEIRLMRALNVLGLFPSVCRRYCHRRNKLNMDWRDHLQKLILARSFAWQKIQAEELIHNLGRFMLWPAGKVTRKLLDKNPFWERNTVNVLIGIVDAKANQIGVIGNIPVYPKNRLMQLNAHSVVLTSDTFSSEILNEIFNLKYEGRIYQYRENGDMLRLNYPS